MIGEGKFADRERYPFPSHVITDLDMAEGDGFDVLEFLQRNPAWSIVPRVMISDSDNPDDIRTAYLLGASAYHKKPASLKSLKELLTHLLAYWLTTELPPVDESGRLQITSAALRGKRFPQSPGGEHMQRQGNLC